MIRLLLLLCAQDNPFELKHPECTITYKRYNYGGLDADTVA